MCLGLCHSQHSSRGNGRETWRNNNEARYKVRGREGVRHSRLRWTRGGKKCTNTSRQVLLTFSGLGMPQRCPRLNTGSTGRLTGQSFFTQYTLPRAMTPVTTPTTLQATTNRPRKRLPFKVGRSLDGRSEQGKVPWPRDWWWWWVDA